MPESPPTLTSGEFICPINNHSYINAASRCYISMPLVLFLYIRLSFVGLCTAYSFSIRARIGRLCSHRWTWISKHPCILSGKAARAKRQKKRTKKQTFVIGIFHNRRCSLFVLASGAFIQVDVDVDVDAVAWLLAKLAALHIQSRARCSTLSYYFE